MPHPRTLLPGFTAQDITVAGGVRIRTAVGGQGPPVLLLHGYPQTHATWREIAPVLAQSFTVVAPDLRGYGDSAKPPSRATSATSGSTRSPLDFTRTSFIESRLHLRRVQTDRPSHLALRMPVDCCRHATVL